MDPPHLISLGVRIKSFDNKATAIVKDEYHFLQVVLKVVNTLLITKIFGCFSALTIKGSTTQSWIKSST